MLRFSRGAENAAGNAVAVLHQMIFVPCEDYLSSEWNQGKGSICALMNIWLEYI